MSDRPMDWTDFVLARQLLAEERVGRAVRADATEEDEAFAAAKAALTRRG